MGARTSGRTRRPCDRRRRRRGTDEGRFAVEDLLTAGAVIDAIADTGIDFTSPEAAAAIGAYAGLRNATGHVLTASVTGKQVVASGDTALMDAARAAHASTELRILKEFRFDA